jgi:hypothetical protein
MIIIALYLLPLAASCAAVATTYGIIRCVYMTIRILLEPPPEPAVARAEARERWTNSLRGYW